ncbi:unnamed protein product, partial [Owenia fusiformis]
TKMEDANSNSGEPESHISCLFPEILAMIFSYLDIRGKGRASQVCVAWRDSAYNRHVWRNVEAKLHLRRANPSLFPSLVKRGIKRVQVLSLRRSLRDLITGIPNLESLNLCGCYNVTDIGLGHAFIQQLPQLTALNLSLCKQVTDSSLGRIGQHVKNLEVLELGGCSNVTSTGLLLVAWGLVKLKRLDLRSCRHIGDIGVGHLCGLSSHCQANGTLSLEYLGLQDCQKLSDLALKHISNGFHNLSSVNLSFCTGITDTGLKYLSKMTSLRHLNLRSCDNISDMGIGYLSEGGSHLTNLDVSFCDRIGDSGMLHLSQGLFHLTRLSLSACNISDDGISSFVKTLHDLDTLNIGQCNRVTDRSLGLISEHLKKLKSIDLYGCTKITTVGLEKIMQIPHLTTLNLGLWHQPANDATNKSSGATSDTWGSTTT